MPEEEAQPTEALRSTASAINEQARSFADRLTGWFDAQSWLPDGWAEPLALVVLFLALAVASWLLYAVVRPHQLYRLPDHIGLDEAALCEPFAAAVQPGPK